MREDELIIGSLRELEVLDDETNVIKQWEQEVSFLENAEREKCMTVSTRSRG